MIETAELDEIGPVEARTREILRRPFDLLGCGLAVALVVVFLPDASNPWWTPRMAVILMTVPVGAVATVNLAWRRDRAAIVATALVVWATVVALFSGAPFVALFGALGRHSSVLILLGAIAAWSIGRSMSPAARNVLGWAIVCAVGASSGFALIQLFIKSSSPLGGLDFGRPTGLAGTPIYFGAHAAAVAAFFAHRAIRRRTLVTCGGYALGVFFCALSGSRIALITALLVTILMIAWYRCPPLLALLPLAVTSAFLAGLVHRMSDTGQSASERLAAGGVGDRVELWGFGLRAWAARPLMGWGTGRFRSASQHWYSNDWVTKNPSDGGWWDAHNYIVETLVGIGFIGLLLVTAFVVLAARRAEGPLVWMAGAIAVGWLVEPAGIQTYGLAALLLGASAPALPGLVDDIKTFRTRTTLALVSVGFALAFMFLVADNSLRNRTDQSSTEELSGLLAIYRHDPVVANLLSTSGPPDEDAGQTALVWATRAAEREQDVAVWWGILGLRRLQAGDLAGAKAAAERGLDLQSNHPVSLQIMQIVAQRTGDEVLSGEMGSRLCAIGSAGCDEASSD
jgi:O-antigen ligase